MKVLFEHKGKKKEEEKKNDTLYKMKINKCKMCINESQRNNSDIMKYFIIKG